MYIKYKKPVAITCCAAVGGKKEAVGPIGDLFDETVADDYFGTDSWEKAETEMQIRTLNHLLHKRGLEKDDINLLCGGDLCNQITPTAFTMRHLGLPFLGLYNACSTMAEGLVVASCMIDGGFADNAVATASSHFCTAERQFRTPLDYGGKRTPTAQWTVTGCGALLLERYGRGAHITAAQVGRVVDFGIKDANNMGAAMAPAAAQTVQEFLKNSGSCPQDFDLIVTGDLGAVGSKLFCQLMEKEGVPVANHLDCGNVVFAPHQNVQSGASGCGCGASVLAAKLLPQLAGGQLGNILFVATGALLSPSTTMQGESIPCIAHLVNIKSKKETDKG